MSYGMDSKIGISFQNSYGTLNTSSMHWLTPISETVGLKKAQLIRKGLRGIYDAGASQEGMNTVAGDISIEADGIGVGVLMKACLQDTVVTSGSLFTHTFKLRTADHDPLSAEHPFTYHKGMGDTGSAQLYSDLNGDNLDLVIANGQLLTAKLAVVGGTYSQIAAISPTYLTNSALDWSVTSATFGGTAKTNIENLTVSIKNSLTAKQTIGGTTKYPDRIKRSGERSVDVAGTILFDDQTELQQFIAQSRQRMMVMVAGASSITSGYNESLTIDIPSFLFTDFPQGIPGPGELSVSFKGIGEYSTTSGTAIAITLVNTKAGY